MFWLQAAVYHVYSLIYSNSLPFKCIHLQGVICSTRFTITQQFSFNYSRVVFSVQSQKTSGWRWKLRPKAILQRILCGVLVSCYCISQMSFPCSYVFFFLFLMKVTTWWDIKRTSDCPCSFFSCCWRGDWVLGGKGSGASWRTWTRTHCWSGCRWDRAMSGICNSLPWSSSACCCLCQTMLTAASKRKCKYWCCAIPAKLKGLFCVIVFDSNKRTIHNCFSFNLSSLQYVKLSEFLEYGTFNIAYQLVEVWQGALRARLEFADRVYNTFIK